MSTFNCPRCDAENDIESAVCANCGLSFSDPDQGIPEFDQLTPDEGQPQQPAPKGQKESEESPQESSEIDDDDAVSEEPTTTDNLDDWLKGLPSPSTADLGKVGEEDDIDGSLPTWLQEVRVTADKKGPAGDAGFVDWLNDLEGDKAKSTESDEELPDWVSALTDPEKWPETEDAEAIADWFEETEGTDDLTMPKTSELPGTQPLKGSRELDGVPDQLVGDSLPTWLMHEAGVDSDLASAEHRPDEESKEFRQTSDAPTMDRYDSATEIEEAEQGIGWLDDSDEDVIEIQPESKDDVAATVISETIGKEEDRWGWLEEFDDRRKDPIPDEKLETEEQTVDEEDVGELLIDKTHGSLAGIGRDTSDEELEIPAPPEELEIPEKPEELEIPAIPQELEILEKPEKLEIPAPPEELEIPAILEELEIPEQSGELELEQILPAEDESPADEYVSEPEATDDWLVDLEGALDGGLDEPAETTILPEELALEPAEIPGWLAAAKPDEDEKTATRQTTIEAEERIGPLTGLQGVIPLATTATGAEQVADPAAYQVTKEHQEQVALLKQLVMVQPNPADTISGAGKKDRLLNGRIVLAVLLVLVILAGWFVPGDIWPPFLTSWSPTVATKNAYETIDLAAGSNVLIAFEYTPAMSGELDAVAESILQRLQANGSHVLTISQAAAGVVMADQALDRSDVADALQIGLLPGDSVGLRGLANCLNQSDPCRSVVNIPIQSEAREQLADVSLIVILTSDRDSLVNWIEQVGVYTDVPIVAGLTQSLGPVASPYLNSDQLADTIDGASASITYDYFRDEGPDQAGQILASLTLAQWLFVAILILGALYFGLFRRSSKTRAR